MLKPEECKSTWIQAKVLNLLFYRWSSYFSFPLRSLLCSVGRSLVSAYVITTCPLTHIFKKMKAVGLY